MLLALSILPIVLTVLAGHVTRRSGVIPADAWGPIETLCFRVLIPAILIRHIATSDLSVASFGPVIAALVASSAALATLLLVLRGAGALGAMPDRAFTSVFQGAVRWNGFVALAAAELFIGAPGMAVIAVAMAVMIPLINVTCIVVLSVYGSARATRAGVLRMVSRNPLVQACAIGLMVNLLGMELPEQLLRTLDLIGGAALGVGLLAVGAGIEGRRLLRVTPPLLLSVALRMGLGPAVFLGLAHILALPAGTALAGAFVIAVPAATNGYIVARQMGGDADLYADILAWQTALSMLALPALALALLG